MKAEIIDWYVHTWRDNHNGTRVGEESIKALLHFFDAISAIATSGSDEYREFYITVECGEPYPFDDDFYSEEDYNDYLDEWKWRYSEPVKWYRICTKRYKSWYSVWIGEGNWPLSVNLAEAPADYAVDYTELFDYLSNQAEKVIEMLKDKTYNSWVRENLPPWYKHGYIIRKDYYDILPEIRRNFRQEISEEQVREFIEIIEKRKQEGYAPELLPQVTANDFYNVCSYLYLSNPDDFKEAEGLTPKEMYKCFADGRDEGMSEVNPDDPKAFAEWLNSRERRGGHPWEITRSMSVSWSIHCYVCTGRSLLSLEELIAKKEPLSGYFFAISGSELGRVIQTVKFFLAVVHAGYPVVLYNMDEIVGRFTETDRVGVLPDSMSPLFMRGEYEDYVNLPEEEEERKKMIEKTVWNEIPEQRLVDIEGEV